MKLIERLRADFPDILFKTGRESLWSPEENTVYCARGDNARLLHELGHALLGHRDFSQDIELLHMERDAWNKARIIGADYGVEIDDQQIETAMDSYRDWLHDRSVCPKCAQNGHQERSGGLYRCLNCDTVWNANDARRTHLRRYKQK
jgi:ribosomal protein L37AE/L43A